MEHVSPTTIPFITCISIYPPSLEHDYVWFVYPAFLNSVDNSGEECIKRAVYGLEGLSKE